MQKEEYTSTKSMLESAKNTAGVRYLYTAKRTADGEYIYLVDGLPSNSGDFRNAGDLLEPEIIPDIERAYQNQVVMPEEIKDTSWGYVLSLIHIYPGNHGSCKRFERTADPSGFQGCAQLREPDLSHKTR